MVIIGIVGAFLAAPSAIAKSSSTVVKQAPAVKVQLGHNGKQCPGAAHRDDARLLRRGTSQAHPAAACVAPFSILLGSGESIPAVVTNAASRSATLADRLSVDAAASAFGRAAVSARLALRWVVLAVLAVVAVSVVVGLVFAGSPVAPRGGRPRSRVSTSAA